MDEKGRFRVLYNSESVKVNKKDVRSGETGLSSLAREPILIRTRLDFRPHFFSIESTKKINNYTFFFFLANFYFHRLLHGSMYLHAYFSPFSQVQTIGRGLETTSHRNEHKTQSLLQSLGVRVHGVQEHGKGGFLSLLAPLLPLLPTGLKTRPKSRHVSRLTCQLRKAIR